MSYQPGMAHDAWHSRITGGSRICGPVAVAGASRLTTVDSLFDEAGERAAASAAPLAVRMRPRTLDEVIGQRHLTAPGTPFRKLIENDAPMSLILWGPPGTGK